MRDDYKNQMASKIAGRYQDLELRIMKDIVRRIKKTGKITSTADWQINRLLILGYSSEDIEKEIKKTLDASENARTAILFPLRCARQMEESRMLHIRTQ